MDSDHSVSYWKLVRRRTRYHSADALGSLFGRGPIYLVVIIGLAFGAWHGGKALVNYAVEQIKEAAAHPVNATKQMAADTKKVVVNGVNGAIDSTREGLGKAKDATVDAVSGAAEVTVREAENLGSGVADWWRGFWGSKQSKQK